MKTRIRILIWLGLTSCTATLLAATLTITIPPNDVPRVTEAFGNMLGLRDAQGNPRPATQQEVQAATQQWIIQTTKDYERRKDIAQFSPPPLEMQPSPTPSPSLTPTP